MMRRIKAWLVCILSSFLFTLFLVPAADSADWELLVPVSLQEHSQWCWAASSHAVLAYYGIDVAQCDIANWVWDRNDCCGNTTFNWDHPCNRFNSLYGSANPPSTLYVLGNWNVISDGQASPFSQATCVSEIDAGRPFVMHWDWASGGIGHALVGYGYEQDGQYLLFMDPWGYGYRRDLYTSVVSASDHTWTHTLKSATNIVTPSVGEGGSIDPTSPQLIQTGAGKSFKLKPDIGYHIASVTGCDGTLSTSVDMAGWYTYMTSTITSNCTVIANFDINEYTVTPSAGANGVIDPATVRITKYNTPVSFTVTPNTGYHIAPVTGCGGSLSGNTYTTAPITADCSVTATFAINTYTVTPSAGSNGTITPATAQQVNYNGTTSFTVTPNTGYHIASVTGTGCGGTLSGNIYTTGPITSNCTVAASFAINTHTVTPSAGANGSVSPAVPQTVNYGSTASFTVSPNTGYHIASVTGCGGTLAGNIYTTGPITANCSVTATFAINTYTITAPASSGGTISPSGTVTLNYGSSQTFTITPNAGNLVAAVTADGVSQGAVSSYTFSNIAANHTIIVSFSVDSCSNLPVQRGTSFYSSLQAAYDDPATTNGAVIKAQAKLFTENVNANRAIAVTLDGGYGCDYSAKIGSANVRGMITTSQGITSIRDFILLQ